MTDFPFPVRIIDKNERRSHDHGEAWATERLKIEY